VTERRSGALLTISAVLHSARDATSGTGSTNWDAVSMRYPRVVLAESAIASSRGRGSMQKALRFQQPSALGLVFAIAVGALILASVVIVFGVAQLLGVEQQGVEDSFRLQTLF
jgi:hypothetical protein